MPIIMEGKYGEPISKNNFESSAFGPFFKMGFYNHWTGLLNSVL